MDTGKLIAMVSDRRALWDASDKNYQMRDVQKRLWDEIAEAMGSDVENVRSKWRNLRDTFRRRYKEVTQGKSGEGAPSEGCTWSYYKSLLFLADSMREKPARRDAPKTSTPPFKRQRPLDRQSSDSSADDYPKSDAMKYDSDYNFLMSLYPYLRDTPADRKLHVRTQMQQVFMQEQERQGSVQPRGQSPLPPKEPSQQYPNSSDQHSNPMMQRHYNHQEAKSSTEAPSQSMVNQQRMTIHSFY